MSTVQALPLKRFVLRSCIARSNAGRSKKPIFCGHLFTEFGRQLPSAKGSYWPLMVRYDQNVVSTTASGNRAGYVPVDSLPGVRTRSSPVFDKNLVPER